MGVYKEFLDLIKANFSETSCRSIVSALRLGAHLSSGNVRYDGSPMFMHSVGVAKIVITEIGLGRNSTVAALLHEVSRRGLLTMEDVDRRFGPECSAILKGMNNISSLDPKTSTLQVDNFKELIISYSKNPRVILLKMADRLEVMRSLGSFPEAKRMKKSWETINIYAPMAHKLGLYNIKSQMEDLSLRYLESKDYHDIELSLSESTSQREAFIASFVGPIQAKLDTLSLNYRIKSRTKSIYSIWKKMKKQKVSFKEVFDIFAIRIIIDCPSDLEKMQCWTAFSVVTDFYTPNPERMRDWISIPKSNGYESLHATVMAPGGRWVEVQIRTQRMDDVAERGLAAHWRYKGVQGGVISSEEWFSRLRNMVESTVLSEPLKEEFDISHSSGETFVFTPTGDLRKLPEGATILDFAFDIHSNLGASCTGGRVNGRNVPIREVLHSGDIVEIITAKSQKPKADWLTIAITNKARNKIRQIIREEQSKSANLGREELERKIKNWKLGLTIEEAVTYLSRHYKVKTGLEVYTLISLQELSMAEIKEVLQRYSINPTDPPQIPKPRKTVSQASKAAAKQSEIIFTDDSLNGLAYKFARCCNPIFGDNIFGFVTIATGVTIHRHDCPNAQRLKEQYRYRIIGATWRNSLSDGAFIATVRVVGVDQVGLANQLTDTLNKLGVNIRTISFVSRVGNIEGTIAIEVGGTAQLERVLYDLKRIEGVTSAIRKHDKGTK